MKKSKSEGKDRKDVVKALKSLHAFPVENPVYPGTPDISFIGGWIEMKKLDAWPVRPTTKVRLDHYTLQQRAWARIHHHRGGQSYWLLRVQREWLLLHGAVAAEVVGTLTKEELKGRAILYMSEGFDGDRLLKQIKELSNAGRHTGSP
jgi:hypothetical protein